MAKPTLVIVRVELSSGEVDELFLRQVADTERDGVHCLRYKSDTGLLEVLIPEPDLN